MTASGDSPEPSTPAGETERHPTDPAHHPDFDALVAKAFADLTPPDDAQDAEQNRESAGDADDQSEGETEAPPISIEDLDNLWVAFLQLEEWVFLVQPMPGRDPFPFIGQLEDQLWLFLFTDHERLRRFADTQGMLDAELNAHFITMNPDQALEWLARLQQSQSAAQYSGPAPPPVYGIRVNEGPNGWYAPLESLPAIHGHLKELERI
ncbi:MAG: hypothetical protein NXI24_02065 [bacterium]|nr:hypothetical protein [bacterium]